MKFCHGEAIEIVTEDFLTPIVEGSSFMQLLLGNRNGR
jgi:hypothetical protein